MLYKFNYKLSVISVSDVHKISNMIVYCSVENIIIKIWFYIDKRRSITECLTVEHDGSLTVRVRIRIQPLRKNRIRILSDFDLIIFTFFFSFDIKSKYKWFINMRLRILKAKFNFRNFKSWCSNRIRPDHCSYLKIPCWKARLASLPGPSTVLPV